MRNNWQSRYLLLVWAYSTNHKRISINYFWFVLFAGVVGMVLATIIRLEMAYPGVGILAGDNSQYLSIVTAHGVIMVFFMAMPLLFGFLGNFLLPTQMGVHDVAFPRMNSAAFWFLPASLLALCQLVCVDRRYQRMNCFNVRELQSLLRNRFIDDIKISNLSLSADTTASLNLKSFLNRSADLNMPESHDGLLGSLFNPRTENSFGFSTSGRPSNSTATSLIWSSVQRSLTQPVYDSANYLYRFAALDLFCLYSFNFFFSVLNTFSLVFAVVKSSIRGLFHLSTPSLIHWSLSFKKTNLNLNHREVSPTELTGYSRLAQDSPELFTTDTTPSSFSNLNANRNLLLPNPSLIYKIKIGNYLPGDFYSVNFKFLFNSINFKSVLGSSLDWFSSALSAEFITEPTGDLLGKTFAHATNKISLSDLILSSANKSTLLLPEVLNTKFISLFTSQHKQARVLNDWRSLELQREGWRCRMLSARHQKSIFRRYVNENELIWVVEKNAKDLLPGWAMITPFSSRTRYTLIGKTDIGILIVAVTLIASMISSANFLMTYRYLSTLNNRKMRDARSFFSESVIAASWMMLAANPMLILGLLMLISDRHWKTCFFDYSGGGDTILFQHMFWFFGHPEVYIIILPCFGITNTLLSFYLRKRISARASLLYSLYTIAFLGFFVWGHHMYMVGLSHTTRMLYSTLTVMISVPAATKIMHWLVTFVNSAVHFELPFILNLLFIFYFVSGGISGMSVAHTGMDVLFHDTFYVIGHFHVMFAGSLMFSAFAAFYFYLPSLFGVRYTRTFAYLHVFYYSLGQIFTVIPMIWLGYLGMPRRVLDYPSAMGGWHSLISSAHIITVSGVLAFVLMLFDSLRKQKGYIIKTFGVGRYNTRLNFYFYQLARNRYWLSKHFTLLPVRAVWHSKSHNQVHNLEYAESTLFFYSFSKRKFYNEWTYL